jgi:cytochrome c551/c552
MYQRYTHVFLHFFSNFQNIGDQMKSVIVSMIAAAGLMVAGSVFHKMEGKLVGPGFKEVAAKYKGDATAEAKLEAKVAKGGAGVWGTMPMPAMANVKAEDIKTMVAFILAQAK